MLKLLGRPNSINVRKVLWLCAELDLPIEHEPWGFGALSLRAPAFLALNPNGKVPVIQDGEFVLWESNAVCRYLVRRQNRDDLLPVAPKRQALVDQWLDWQATDLNASWRYAFMALVRESPGFQDAAATESSIADWNRHMRMLDDQLSATGAHVTGDAFTLADVGLGLAAYRWTMTPMQRPSLPAVDAWLARLRQRPGFITHGANGTP